MEFVSPYEPHVPVWDILKISKFISYMTQQECHNRNTFSDSQWQHWLCWWEWHFIMSIASFLTEQTVLWDELDRLRFSTGLLSEIHDQSSLHDCEVLMHRGTLHLSPEWLRHKFHKQRSIAPVHILPRPGRPVDSLQQWPIYWDHRETALIDSLCQWHLLPSSLWMCHDTLDLSWLLSSRDAVYSTCFPL